MKSSHNYLIVSDLHLSEGKLPATGKYSRNEDFFHDDAFARFLAYHIELSHDPKAPTYFQNKPWKLIINGDIFDFLQVTSLPAEGEELLRVHGVRLHSELSDNKRTYGLGTTSAEIVWKLERIAAGHPTFFAALGWWLAHEQCEVILLKGNHDVELYWPAVQKRMGELIADAYTTWYAEYKQGRFPRSALPYHDHLPPNLNENHIDHLQFPAWFYYEPDLLFVEHGNQYDPANAFSNFLEPLLPFQPEAIELPAGSFFVRYFFNKIEQVHPFADNIKPIMQYIWWAINEEPVDTLRMFISQRRIIAKSIWNLRKKEANPIKGRPNLHQPNKKVRNEVDFQVPLNTFRWQQLRELRDNFQKMATEMGTRTSWTTASAVSLGGFHLFAIAFALRSFVHEKWRALFLSLVAALATFAGKTVLTEQVKRFDSLITVKDVATAICTAFNKPDPTGNQIHARYYCMGHNHQPDVSLIADPSEHAPAYKQWYVNTGSWLPVFNESDRLTRGDIQLTFFRLAPEDPNTDHKRPVVWEWLPDADRPRPVRLFE